jgi:hypothetical protein
MHDGMGGGVAQGGGHLEALRHLAMIVDEVGGDLPFAAPVTNGSSAQGAGFAKSSPDHDSGPSCQM